MTLGGNFEAFRFGHFQRCRARDAHKRARATLQEPLRAFLRAPSIPIDDDPPPGTNQKTQDELQWIVAQGLLSALTIPGFNYVVCKRFSDANVCN